MDEEARTVGASASWPRRPVSRSGRSIITTASGCWRRSSAPTPGYRNYDRDGVRPALPDPRAARTRLPAGRDRRHCSTPTPARCARRPALSSSKRTWTSARTEDLREQPNRVLDADEGRPSPDETDRHDGGDDHEREADPDRDPAAATTARPGGPDGDRVGKDDPAIEAGGEVDELSAAARLRALDARGRRRARRWLRRIQNDLFDLGAELSAPAAARRVTRRRGSRGTISTWLEEICDELNAALEPLDSFLLPGGGPVPRAAAGLPRRLPARRAPRLVATGEAGPAALAYLNRLSDFLFILARSVDHDEAVCEPRPRRGRS